MYGLIPFFIAQYQVLVFQSGRVLVVRPVAIFMHHSLVAQNLEVIVAGVAQHKSTQFLAGVKIIIYLPRRVANVAFYFPNVSVFGVFP